MSRSGPLSPGAFAALLQAKGRRGEGTNYYQKLEATKKGKMGSKMYERKKMLKMLKKHLTKLIMGVKYGPQTGSKAGTIKAAPAPDWQLAQMRVMMGRCPFRTDCRQNKAIDTGRVQEGALGYGGAMGAKRVLLPNKGGVRRRGTNMAADAVKRALIMKAGKKEMKALRFTKARREKSKIPASVKASALVAMGGPTGTHSNPYPTLKEALEALGVTKFKNVPAKNRPVFRLKDGRPYKLRNKNGLKKT